MLKNCVAVVISFILTNAQTDSVALSSPLKS